MLALAGIVWLILATRLRERPSNWRLAGFGAATGLLALIDTPFFIGGTGGGFGRSGSHQEDVAYCRRQCFGFVRVHRGRVAMDVSLLACHRWACVADPWQFRN